MTLTTLQQDDRCFLSTLHQPTIRRKTVYLPHLASIMYKYHKMFIKIIYFIGINNINNNNHYYRFIAPEGSIKTVIKCEYFLLFIKS